jgi:hypothetical protein
VTTPAPATSVAGKGVGPLRPAPLWVPSVAPVRRAVARVTAKVTTIVPAAAPVAGTADALLAHL